MSKCNRISVGLVSLFFVSGLASSLMAQSSKQTAEEERALQAAQVLTEIMAVPETSIPDDLIGRAHGIAVIPHVVKGAFGFGGQWGRGLMSQRRKDGTWSSPSYVEIGGGSFGLQIGVQATDIVLVFTDEDGLKGLLKSRVKLGADASVAAGPVGRKAEVGTDATLRSEIFAYSRSKGLFAGISLDGSVISIDDGANSEIYGKDLNTEQILFGKTVTGNAGVQEFVKTLQQVSPARVRTSRKSD